VDTKQGLSLLIIKDQFEANKRFAWILEGKLDNFYEAPCCIFGSLDDLIHHRVVKLPLMDITCPLDDIKKVVEPAV
jgi:hypothetical protein